MAGKQRSVMTHKFSEVPRAEIPRSSFDRSSGLKTAFDAGLLIPVFLDEALPGDTFNLNMTAFARLATPIFPVMDNIFLDSFFFFVPNRLLWENWERFCGATIPDPDSSIDFTIPTVDDHIPQLNSLSDYLGLPARGVVVSGASQLPFRAYNLIWNSWFRDQNLQDSEDEHVTDAGQSVNEFPLKSRGKRHDYFTSALPWAQKGQEKY